jgi:hypothetical protein
VAARRVLWAGGGVNPSGSGRVNGSNLWERENDLDYSEMNFYSMQNSIENRKKYLETSEKDENISRDRLGYLAQLLYWTL